MPSTSTRDAAVLRDAALGDVEVGEDLQARHDGGDRAGRDQGGLLEHAVDAVADAHVLVAGLEVDVGGAALDGLLDDPVHELDDRGVLAGGAEVDRRVVAQVVERAGGRGRRRRRRGVRVVGVVLDRRSRAVAEVGVLHAVDQRLDGGRRRHRRADLVAGHHRDVVLREHVGRVGHGDQQRPLAGERDRHGLVAAGGRGGDELGGVGVDAVDAEVDVVEPEALRDRARELVLGQRPVGDQQPLGQRAVVVGALDREIDRALLDEAQVDEDVREHAAGSTPP